MVLRTLIQIWMIAWVLAVPIFHIHKLDVREISVVSPAAIPHTVFSPDLQGEFALRPAIWGDGRLSQSDAIASHTPHYLEIGIALFNEENPKRKAESQAGIRAREPRPAGLLLAKALPAGSRFAVSPSKFPLALVSPRAPPSDVS